MSQRAEFEERGFVTVPAFLGTDELAEVNRCVDHVIAEVAPGLPPELVYFEDKADRASLKQIQRLFEHDRYFDDLMFGSRFEQFARELLGEPVVGKNMQFFDKPAGKSKPTPPHQDGFYFMLDPCRAVTMWLALEDVSPEQGCVSYVVGSHHRGLRDHAPSKVLGFSQHIVDYGTAEDLANEVLCPCTAGTLMVHDARTIHAAGANQTADRSRRALGFIYYGASAREDAVAHAAYQARLATQLAESDLI